MKAKDIVLIGALSALLFISQTVLSFLPGVELVSTLLIAITLVLGRKTLYVIYTFAVCEGLVYGFGVWWIMYLYIWTILYFLVRICKKQNSKLFWALLSGGYGLIFGALCSLPYFFIGGIGGGVAYWIRGIPVDLVHGLGNFVIALITLDPIKWALQQLYIMDDKCME